MTRDAFLSALRAAVIAKGYPWLDNPHPTEPHLTRLDYFMRETKRTLDGTLNAVNIDSPSFVEAWRAIGGKGKPTYKGLRALA